MLQRYQLGIYSRKPDNRNERCNNRMVCSTNDLHKEHEPNGSPSAAKSLLAVPNSISQNTQENTSLFQKLTSFPMPQRKTQVNAFGNEEQKVLVLLQNEVSKDEENTQIYGKLNRKRSISYSGMSDFYD